MARRRAYKPYSKATKRDQYGRFKGKGSVKPWKSNFKTPKGSPRYYAPGGKTYTTFPAARKSAMKATGGTAKKSNLKRNIAVGAVAVGAVGATAYGIHKYRANGGRFPGENPRISNRARVRHGQMKAKGLTKLMGMSVGTNLLNRAVKTAVDTTVPRSVVGRPTGKPRRASSGVVNPAPNPQVAPAKVSTPKAVNAASLIAPKASTAQVAAKAVEGDSKTVGVKPGTAEYWKRVTVAQKAGIPAAAIYVENGGKLPGEKGYSGPKSPKGDASVLAPSAPAVVKDAKPKKDKKASVKEVKKAVTFSSDPGIIAVAQDPELRLVNPNGRPVKSFLSINSKQRTPPGQPGPTWKRKDGTEVPNTVKGTQGAKGAATVKNSAPKKKQPSPVTEGEQLKKGKSIPAGNSKVAPPPNVKPNPTAAPRKIKGAPVMPRSLAEYNEAWVDPDAEVKYKNMNKLVPGKITNKSPEVLTLEQQKALYKSLGKKKRAHRDFEARAAAATSVEENLGLIGGSGKATRVKGTTGGRSAAHKTPTTPVPGKVIEANVQKQLVKLAKSYENARTPAEKATVLERVLNIAPGAQLTREQRRIREEYGF